MTDLSEPDDQTFLLATGEEVGLRGQADAPASGGSASAPGAPRPTYRDRRTAGRLRARKVRRLVRHIEPWSVLKLSLIFYFCLWVIFLISGVILWSLAVGSGTIDNLESFIEKLLALDSFEFEGDQIFRASALGGLVLVVAGSGFTVLVAVLFNLISDLTGGMRITVVEEETARPRPKRTRPRRAPAPQAARPPGTMPAATLTADATGATPTPPPVAESTGAAPVLPTAEAPAAEPRKVATAPPDR